jgi:hypothetical protein
LHAHLRREGNTWTIAFVGVLYVAVAHLTTRELAAGSLLLGPVLAYLLSHQLVHRHHRWRVPKEICIALLLTGGVLVFLIPVSGVSTLAAPAAALGVLCFTNCVLISSWERHIDEVHGQTSLATGLTPARLRQVAALPWLSAAVVLALLIGGTGLPVRTATCAGGSAILLGVINHFQHRMGWQLARVLADAALMTPVLPLAWTL